MSVLAEAPHQRAIRARGSFDEERATAIRCRCGRTVTGTNDCMFGAPCPYEAPHRGFWAQPEEQPLCE